MKSGKFITVEGLDGVGKTTQIEYIGNRIRDAGIPLVSTREPGGTDLGEQVRDILLDRSDLDISPDSELMLIFASRVQHLEYVIRPALNSGTWVLCDRFTDATYAYQGGGRKIPLNRIQVLEKWMREGLQPDLTLLFDAAIETAARRTRSIDAPGDRFERQGEGFKADVKEHYLKRANQFPERIKMIDSNGSIESVRIQIDRALESFNGVFAKK